MGWGVCYVSGLYFDCVMVEICVVAVRKSQLPTLPVGGISRHFATYSFRKRRCATYSHYGSALLYAILFLHQTTTICCALILSHGCIISFSYIKPQLVDIMPIVNYCCILSFSYIKPQLLRVMRRRYRGCILSFSYIKPQPAVTIFSISLRCILSFSYIKPQQGGQTTDTSACCILSFSYIKPQRKRWKICVISVVYYPFPTSNHNCHIIPPYSLSLYTILFLHQTTTLIRERMCQTGLYTILFLHQTTT